MVSIESGITMPFKITVTAFKETGKYYSSQVTILKKDHQFIHGFDLEDLIRKNAKEVHEYSPISGGFSEGLFYTVEVEYPPEVNNFCNRLFDKTSLD